MAFLSNSNMLTSVDCDGDSESWRRTRTPSREDIYCYQGSARTLPPRDLLPSCSPQQSPQFQPVANGMQVVAVFMMPVMQPPPAPFVPATFQESEAGSPLSKHSRMPSGGSDASTTVSEDSDAASSSAPALSAGTRGHPFHCGDACKFFGKPRGCKDGANCTHCHLCKWKKTVAKKQAKLRQQEQSAALNLTACFSGAC